MFLITLALAFMARTVPDMNVFAVGFSLRLMIGLAVVGVGVPVFRWIFLMAYGKSVEHLQELLKLMG
jgi:flagellar biosynthetic protein FliR